MSMISESNRRRISDSLKYIRRVYQESRISDIKSEIDNRKDEQLRPYDIGDIHVYFTTNYTRILYMIHTSVIVRLSIH